MVANGPSGWLNGFVLHQLKNWLCDKTVGRVGVRQWDVFDTRLPKDSFSIASVSAATHEDAVRLAVAATGIDAEHLLVRDDFSDVW